jgi:hypothetical protein
MKKNIQTLIRVPARRNMSVLQMSGATLTVGTRVLTPMGEQLVEDLKPGDQVISRDYGAQAVRYTAFQDIKITELSLAPIHLNYPGVGSAYFAPAQKIVLRHAMFDVLFGNSEVLVTCADLIDMPGATQSTGLSSITYVALGFALHHLVTCNGITVDIGPPAEKASRPCLSGEEAHLAWRLITPTESLPKRHGFPLH